MHICLVSAHAKERLSPILEAEVDVKAAMDILSFALYHENNSIGSVVMVLTVYS